MTAWPNGKRSHYSPGNKVKQADRRAIVEALIYTKNISAAARMLGCTRETIRQQNIPKSEWILTPVEGVERPLGRKERRRAAIIDALVETKSMKGAALLLNTARSTIYNQCRILNITQEDWINGKVEPILTIVPPQAPEPIVENFFTVNLQNGAYGVITRDLTGECEFKLAFKCRDAATATKTAAKLNEV